MLYIVAGHHRYATTGGPPGLAASCEVSIHIQVNMFRALPVLVYKVIFVNQSGQANQVSDKSLESKVRLLIGL